MFKGVLTPVITVLDQEGNFDYAGNEAVIERLIANGMNGLLFFGSIGEFFAFTAEEKRQFIRFVVKTVNKRVPVLIGTGGTNQSEVNELTAFAQEAGADGAVLISPYYFKLDAETIYRYYAGVARRTTLPLMLYNFPDRTGSDLTPELVLRLALDFPHIVAIKDTVDSISHTRRLIHTVKARRPDFTILSGYDEYMIPNLLAGGDGVLCGLTNVVPELFSGLLRAYRAQDFAAVAAGQAKVSLLMNLYDLANPFVAAIKGAAALQAQGAFEPAVKAPAAPLTAQQLEAIGALLAKATAM